ncbi:hypothetical protein AtNW77_Chr2g0249151 [Arabidopsis thaliana]
MTNGFKANHDKVMGIIGEAEEILDEAWGCLQKMNGSSQGTHAPGIRQG